MAPRNKRTCPNCPKKAKPTAPLPEAKVQYITHGSQGQYMWNWALFGTNSCINILEGFLKSKVPGEAKKRMIELRDRLDSLIQKCEK